MPFYERHAIILDGGLLIFYDSEIITNINILYLASKEMKE